MSKGSRREREAVSLYHESGMGTYRPATVQYGENDVFGLFDILAFSPEHEQIHAVQVKSNGARGIRKWVEHTRLFRRLGMRTFYLVPYDNEGWRLIEVYGRYVKSADTWIESREDRVDERDENGPMGSGVVEYLEGES